MRTNTYPRKLLLVFSFSRRSALMIRPRHSAANCCCCCRQSMSTSSRPPSSWSGSGSSSSSSSSSSNWKGVEQWHYHHRNSEEDSRNVVVRVWWDLESCQIPKGVDPYRVAHRITWALRSHGIRGPLSINAFGDILHLSNKTRDALCTTGISLCHVPNRGMNCANRSILADLVSWVAQNPPPAHFFLIAGDRDFADILHRLRMNNYNILIASSDGASGALCSAATIMWYWNGLVMGDEHIGRYFNYPPDGQHSSWYGNYRGTLENPFLVAEEDTSLQAEDCAKAAGDARIRPIPLALVRKISDILSSNPAGIGMNNLLMEIKRSNTVLDKDYFGHKKFLNLISSMPQIAKIKPHPTIEGRHIVYSALGKSSESGPPDFRSIREESNHISGDWLKSGEVDGNLPSPPAEMHGKSSSGFSPSVQNHCVEECIPVKDGNPSHLDTEPNVTVAETSLKGAGTANIALKNHAVETSTGEIEDGANVSISTQENIASFKDRFLKRFWPIWLTSGSRVAKNDNTSISSSHVAGSSGKHHYQHITDNSKDSGKSISRRDASNKLHSDLPCESHDRRESVLSNFSKPKSSVDKDIQSKIAYSRSPVACYSTQDDSATECMKEHDVIAMSNSGFLQRIKMWFNFWKTGLDNMERVSIDSEKGLNTPTPDKQSKGLLEKNAKLGLQPKPLVLFSKPHFWQSMEYFLHTNQGSELVSKSTSRIHLVKGLQKEGPSILISLEECHILHLVDLLITEKRWIDECASQANPFKLVVPYRRTCIPINAQRQNGLSHIFQSKKPQTGHQTVERQDFPGKNCELIASFPYRKVETKAPKNLEELKIWYHRVFAANELVRAKDFKQNFERDFGKKLDSLTYGYASVEDLLAVCSASCSANQAKGPTLLSQEEVISDCKSLVAEIFGKNPDGISLNSFKLMFLGKYGYPLDYKKLGPSKLMSILKAIPGIRVDSEMILPSCTSNSDSSRDKHLSNQAIDSLVDVDQHKCTEDEDLAWDELGPPKECEVNRCNENKIAEKGLLFEEVSMSDEDCSDVEYLTATGTDALEPEGNKRKGEETLLLQILESWHRGKETTEETLQQSVDSLVDCSGKFNKKHAELKPSVSSSSKVRSTKSYNFVSVDEGEKDTVRNNVLSWPK